MSGRSAYVRKRKPKTLENTHNQASEASTQHSDGLDEEGDLRSENHPQPFHLAPIVQGKSVSSDGTSHEYLKQPPGKPQLTVIAPVIEKSDFRTHMDGMTSTFRGKLGRWMKISNKNADLPQRKFRRESVGSDPNGPSASEVPELIPTMALSDHPKEFSNQGALTTRPSENGQEQGNQNIRFKKFVGGGKPPSRNWHIRPLELWDDCADTFIYVYDRGMSSKPPPSFRVNSRIIKQSGSRIFMSQLHNNEVPEGWPRFCPSDLPSPNWSSSAGDNSASFDALQNPISSALTRSEHSDIDAIQPSSSASRQSTGGLYKGVQHEIYVEWPGPDSGMDNTTWHIATRNYFAVLFGAKTLVGATLYEAMMTLFKRLQAYPDYLSQDVNPRTWLIEYLVQHKFDVVQNNASAAASLLAFSEGIEWREGYIEGYLHATGMFNQGLQDTADWRMVSVQTKIFVENAQIDIESRLYRAQRWLHTFDFAAMWPFSSSPTTNARGCFDRLRKYLCKHYATMEMFKKWPPTDEQVWLSRSVIVQLSQDFNDLYDCLVDQDVVFDSFDYRNPGKWTIQSKSGQAFHADSNELPFTEIITSWDDRNQFPHIPHPYPITPPTTPTKARPKQSFMSRKPPADSELVAQLRRKALSYSEATNLFISHLPVQSDFVKKFLQFEQRDDLEMVDPCEARRGRWILIYGIMQVLATIAVDSPLIRHKDGIQHHINARMKGIVPWSKRGSPLEPQANHELSHCWTVPNSWPVIVPQARRNAYKPIICGPFGDGRARANLFDEKYSDQEILPTDNKPSYPEKELPYVEKEIPQKEKIPSFRSMTPSTEGKIPSFRAMTPSTEGKAPSHVAEAATILEQAHPLYYSNLRNATALKPVETSTSIGKTRVGSPKPVETIESIGRARFNPPRTTETNMSIGIKKAEEWVASAQSQLLDSSSDSEERTSAKASQETKVKSLYLGSRFGLNGAANVDCTPDSASEMARKRRKEIHGFTDFQKPANW